MIIERLLWPMLQYRFGVPAAPSWFQRRVRQQLLVQSNRRLTMRGVLQANLLVMPAYILVSRHVTLDIYHWSEDIARILCICLMIPVGWTCGLAWMECREAYTLLRAGDVAMQHAVQDVIMNMTGHERMEHAAMIRISGPGAWVPPGEA